MRRKNLKVGLRVELKVALYDALPAGAIGIVDEVEPDECKDELSCSVLFDGFISPWWVSESQIRIADKVRKAKPSEPAPSTKMTWPWPEGTLVRLTGYREVCVLGSDGSDLPPVLTLDGKRLCFVGENSVTLAEDPEVAA